MLPTSVKDKIICDLKSYRYKVCEKVAKPTVTLLIGMELSTGLSDKMIENIAFQCNGNLLRNLITSKWMYLKFMVTQYFKLYNELSYTETMM